MKIGQFLKQPDKQGQITLEPREASVKEQGLRDKEQKEVMQQGKFRKFCHGLKETLCLYFSVLPCASTAFRSCTAEHRELSKM